MNIRWLKELAWASGFFDGEGHVGVGGGGKRVDLYLQITQADRRVLDRFQAAMGCGHVVGPYMHPVSQKRGNEQPRYYFQTQRFEHVQAIIAFMWDTLDVVKREQAVSALTRVKARANHRPTCKNGHPRTSENLVMFGPANRWRGCRACQREKARTHGRKRLLMYRAQRLPIEAYDALVASYAAG